MPTFAGADAWLETVNSYAEANREDVKAKRKEWAAFQHTVDPARLVFLDESGVNTGTGCSLMFNSNS